MRKRGTRVCNDESFQRVEERVEEFSQVSGWDDDCLEERMERK